MSEWPMSRQAGLRAPPLTRRLEEVLERRECAARPAWIPRASLTPALPPPEVAVAPAAASPASEPTAPPPDPPRLAMEQSDALERLRESVSRLDAALETAPAAEDLLSLASALAEVILDRELSLDRDTLLRGVEAGLQAIGPERPVRIRAASTEYAYLHESLPPTARAGVRIIEDPRLERGRVLLETATRAFDASPATRLERLVRAVRESTHEGGRPSVVMRLIGNGGE